MTLTTPVADNTRYVPPYWTHAVESTTNALSLSTISPSWLEAIVGRIKRVPLPFARLSSPKQRAQGVHVYLRALLRAGLLDEIDTSLPGAVHAARHAEVGGHHERLGDAGSHVGVRTNAQLQCDTWLQPSAVDLEASTLLDAREVEQAVGAVRAVLSTREGERRVGTAVAREVLSAYIEELAAWAVGEPQSSTLVYCLGEAVQL